MLPLVSLSLSLSLYDTLLNRNDSALLIPRDDDCETNRRQLWALRIPCAGAERITIRLQLLTYCLLFASAHMIASLLTNRSAIVKSVSFFLVAAASASPIILAYLLAGIVSVSYTRAINSG